MMLIDTLDRCEPNLSPTRAAERTDKSINYRFTQPMTSITTTPSKTKNPDTRMYQGFVLRAGIEPGS